MRAARSCAVASSPRCAVLSASTSARPERTGGVVDGLPVPLARRTGDGSVVEVRESREDVERSGAEVVGPLPAEVLQGRHRLTTVVGPFDVRGLVLPRAGVAD